MFESRQSPPNTSSQKNNHNVSPTGVRIIEAVRGLKYGEVVIVVQNGRIVQLERTEKLRFPQVEGAYGDGI
ncbi:YezD family protein [Heliobacterium chlorum]|uniref:YezD family protein n=1 Tax=Heliobacterium chlorum TaxID=2698 RepID=A0ABR7T0J6_HELCL|nr:YezD family protein [Heliobacterium chlorum]MBC9783622.1 YezD family protein [Heliobacterium chlorum]